MRRRTPPALVSTFFAAVLGAEKLGAAAGLAALATRDNADVRSWEHVIALVPLVPALSAAKSRGVEVSQNTAGPAHLAAAMYDHV